MQLLQLAWSTGAFEHLRHPCSALHGSMLSPLFTASRKAGRVSSLHLLAPWLLGDTCLASSGVVVLMTSPSALVVPWLSLTTIFKTMAVFKQGNGCISCTHTDLPHTCPSVVVIAGCAGTLAKSFRVHAWKALLNAVLVAAALDCLCA